MPTRRRFIRVLAAICMLPKLESQARAVVSNGRELHVSKYGNDANDGAPTAMLKTISAAAALAQPGDVITVHEGIYRERVNPPRGGGSDTKRIVYRAAPGEQVEISGADVVKGWVKVQGDVWRVAIPNRFFGAFNPYADLIHGDWFDGKGREHHTGAVYLNSEWLTEAAKLDEVLKPTGGAPLWFGEVDDETTTIWAQFNGMNPNEQCAEINVRQTVFYPANTGCNYITVRGFVLRQAATPWAPPTAKQIGVIGTHWSKGWIIENNVVRHSICSGIALGKYGDQFDNTSADTAEGYVKTVERAWKNGWAKQNIGGHIVRGNTVSNCEQAGIVGSLGAAFSTVTGNTIHDIHVRQLFTGAEMAGIKFHGAIDVEISHNHVYRNCRGLWLDWMAQGTRVSANLFYDNLEQDLFVEVDHGPFFVDNNIFLSRTSLLVVSQGGAFVHNLFCGNVKVDHFDSRMTPFLQAHSTTLGGYHDNPDGDIRFYNNLFAQAGDISSYNHATLPVWAAGNVFLKGTKSTTHEAAPMLVPEFDPKIKLVEAKDGPFLEFMLDPRWSVGVPRKVVGTNLLGEASISEQRFENADGSPIRIDTDYSGRARNQANPFPGPFECLEGGRQTLNLR